MNQPIHTTIKPIIKAAPERFELKWSHTERFTAASAGTSVGGSDLPIQVFCARLSNQTFAELATALEIILQCRTFSPGVFERDENGRWRRAGKNPKHANTEGC